MYILFMAAYYAKWSTCDKEHTGVKPKILTIWPLRESLPAPRLVILCLVCTIMSSLKNLSI